jgi:hypothetical protein
MNKVLITIVALLILAVLAYKTLYKPAKTMVVYPSPTPIAIDLKKELMQTEDDGGQADFDVLSKDAIGL